MIELTTPLTDSAITSLRAGEQVLLSGVVYTGRDAAHARMAEAIKNNEKLPVDLAGQVIYYVGPTPAPPGRVIGSAGPTTSGRMDAFSQVMLEQGLKGMVGKGIRNEETVSLLAKYKAVYLAATGGAAALLAKRIISCEVIAYPDLGCEAIHRLVVDKLPLIVINDIYGNDFYRKRFNASP